MSGKIRKYIFPIIMITAGIALMLGSAFWYVRSNGNKATATTSQPTVRIPHPEIARISVEDAKAAYDLGNAVFIDTRGEPYYSQGHIPGALVLTEDELPDGLDETDSNAWIITYCT